MNSNALFQALGFRWHGVSLPSPSAPDQAGALFRLQKLFPELVFDIVHLEGNAHTFPEVQTVLEGITVGGRKVSDTEQIINQQQAMNLLVELTRHRAFALTREIFCSFNALAAKGEAIGAGAFRTGSVGIAGTEWRPPSAELLDAMFARSGAALADVRHPLERGIAFFLFGARNQFFFDGNKRSSRLMMNGILLEAGQDIITIPAKLRLEFNAKMVDFYTTGDASEMMRFLSALQIKKRFEP